MIAIMHDLALILGWALLSGALAYAAIEGTDIALREPVKKLIILGIGPVWFRISTNGPLYENMKKIGFRIFRRGDWAFGLSLPRWLGRIVRKVAG